MKINDYNVILDTKILTFHWKLKSQNSVPGKTLRPKRSIVGRRCASSNILSLERSFQFGINPRLPRIFLTRNDVALRYGTVLFHPGEVIFQTLECYHDHCDVIKSFLVESQLHYILNRHSTKLVNAPVLILASRKSLPYDFYDLVVG